MMTPTFLFPAFLRIPFQAYLMPPVVCKTQQDGEDEDEEGVMEVWEAGSLLLLTITQEVRYNSSGIEHTSTIKGSILAICLMKLLYALLLMTN